MDEPYAPTVSSQSDLEEVWRRLMQPLGFGRHSTWLMVIGADRRPLPMLTEITDSEVVPDDVEPFAQLLAMIDDRDPGGSFAFLRSRPGAGVDDRDRAWAGFLYAAGRAAEVRVEVVHLATDRDVVPLPLDEVGLPPVA
jgi:hypothetical protein